MAETSTWTGKVACRYYSIGICTKGDNCHYLHDGPVRQGNSSQQGICDYFLKGKCKFGDRCRYKHPGQNNGGNSNSNMRKPLNQGGATAKASSKDKGENKKVTLSKGKENCNAGKVLCNGQSPSKKDKEFLNPTAPEFVPGISFNSEALSYSGATKSTLSESQDVSEEASASVFLNSLPPQKRVLCPFIADGLCQYGDTCDYMHGFICDYCQKPALHPYDPQQNKQHLNECQEDMEKDMELSFAIQRSKDKACGICMEVIMEKEDPAERKFGLLSDCNHCYCLTCIRKWRQAKQFENKVIRSCPECRVPSDFVTPSKYWAEDTEDKKKMIDGYKDALSKKPCRYFDQGRGECPFNEKCFYKHAYPDGRIAEPVPRPRRVRNNSHGDLEFLQHALLWDFLDSPSDYSLFDVIDELFNCSDTESDDDDYDYLYVHL